MYFIFIFYFKYAFIYTAEHCFKKYSANNSVSNIHI